MEASDAPQPFANYQYEIYVGGLAEQRPKYPLTYRELEAGAREKLSPEAYGYVAGAAGAETTERYNREAFHRWRIVPRMLRDTSARDLTMDVLGTKLPAPFMLAPIGVQQIIHPDGELATARAAAATGVPFILSTAASNTIEDVAAQAGDVPRWYQLYWPSDDEVTKSFLSRAEQSGFSAIVVTLDTFYLAWRPRDLTAAYLPFLKGIGNQIYFSDPAFNEPLEKSFEDDPQASIARWISVYTHQTATWEKLALIRDNTSLPVLLKGILHPQDAAKAVDLGIDGIVVSNHGGRQVDGSISSLEALPAIVDAVPEDYPLLLDSGIRSPADAFKAIALGAKAVLLGRPYAWALALGGEEGVATYLKGFLAELDLSLALAGYNSFDEVGPEALTRAES
ncbi:MAG: lactate 2-monooxygenase [Thermoleophilaceae bacterium]|nr:lactate 2-monooxygenase [Thermoleophilaceae bacterium]